MITTMDTPQNSGSAAGWMQALHREQQRLFMYLLFALSLAWLCYFRIMLTFSY
jgi:hypothetical protein